MALQVVVGVNVNVAVGEQMFPITQVAQTDLTWNPDPEDPEAERMLAEDALDKLVEEAVEKTRERLRAWANAVANQQGGE